MYEKEKAYSVKLIHCTPYILLICWLIMGLLYFDSLFYFDFKYDDKILNGFYIISKKHN